MNSVIAGFQGPWSLARNLAQSRQAAPSNDSREHLLDRAEDLKRNHVDAEQCGIDQASEQEPIPVGCKKAEDRSEEYPFPEMEDLVKCRGIPLPAVGSAGEPNVAQ